MLLKVKSFPNAVNLPAMEREELKEMKPYIELMESLGKVYYQLHKETC